jgi:hypothetical protein
MSAAASAQSQTKLGLLARNHNIARPSFNRWLVRPAALAIHLCIGMTYGFSVFWLPLSRAIGVSQPLARARPASFRRSAGAVAW